MGERGATRTPSSARTAEREELLDLLRRDAILHRTEDQPILSRDGTSARWMLDSLSVTLTRRGAELAARCLLGLLEGFTGRQLATYGLTGVPLLQGCVLLGDGRYRGVLVRKERKAHGSLKLIEGQLDRSEPVVIVDDSVSSGLSMEACAEALEAAGFHVEGGVCLVRFDYERGTLRMVERGYRMASVFDIYADFIAHMDGETPIVANPTKWFGELVRTPQAAPDGLHPADLARKAIAEYLWTGQVLRAPATLDRSYDSAGGCWVSLRRRSNIHDRPARNGFWHFPGEPRGTAGDDVVLAAVRTAQELLDQPGHDPGETLDDCALAVTFFSALVECAVGDLDNDRYGIVVRSRERPWAMGGALPRMPGIRTDWEQFAHARITNARLAPLEPYRLYRHRVEKIVAPGEAWQPTGVPRTAALPSAQRPSVARPLAEAARRWVLEALGVAPSQPAPRLRVPAGIDLAFVTVYADGRLAGCMGGPLGDDEESLHTYARMAAADDRFPPLTSTSPRRVAVSVSLLSNRHEIGTADPEWVVRPTRFADQVLEVDQGARRGLLLPFVAVMNDLTPIQYVYEVIDKAGITRAPYHWTRYDCATWLADGSVTVPLDHGLPRGQPGTTAQAQLARLWPLLVGYARRHHVGRGDPVGRYEPFADRLRTGLAPARLAYGAWVKARIGLHSEAAAEVRRLERARRKDGWIAFDGESPAISELAFLLLAKTELAGDRSDRAALAARLWAQVDNDGRFSTHRDATAADPGFQDYSPGQALLALATAAERGDAPVEKEALARALRFYRMRWELNRHWGAVAWLTQAFTAWGRVLADPSLTAFAYEIVDWALQFQSRKSGGFLNDHQSDSPGATTALYLEAVATVREAAENEGDRVRERRYRNACARGLAFLDQLVYQPRDAAVLPNPAWAMGGLRTSLTSSEVRIDYVFHALAALSALRPVLAPEE